MTKSLCIQMANRNNIPRSRAVEQVKVCEFISWAGRQVEYLSPYSQQSNVGKHTVSHTNNPTGKAAVDSHWKDTEAGAKKVTGSG